MKHMPLPSFIAIKPTKSVVVQCILNYTQGLVQEKSNEMKKGRKGPKVLEILRLKSFRRLNKSEVLHKYYMNFLSPLV